MRRRLTWLILNEKAGAGKMFTGIIEEVGTVHSIEKGAGMTLLSIRADKVLRGSTTGDSIAVNGVCLTVTSIGGGVFFADVMAETLRKSSLGGLSVGSGVNLERAMPACGRFGGHIVSGHIDGVGKILSKTREGGAVWLKIGANPEIMKYIVKKGSIAIDGISLTVANLDENGFYVSIIPHTGTQTVLLEKDTGDNVNLENDVIGKYVERLLNFDAAKNDAVVRPEIDMDFLIKNGF